MSRITDRRRSKFRDDPGEEMRWLFWYLRLSDVGMHDMKQKRGKPISTVLMKESNICGWDPVISPIRSWHFLYSSCRSSSHGSEQKHGWSRWYPCFLSSNGWSGSSCSIGWKEVVTKMCGDEKGGSAMNTLPYGPGPLWGINDEIWSNDNIKKWKGMPFEKWDGKWRAGCIW